VKFLIYINLGGQSRSYQSQWKLILKDYQALCAQVHNASQLLEDTNLVLYTINQTGLVRKVWKARTDAILEKRRDDKEKKRRNTSSNI